MEKKLVLEKKFCYAWQIFKGIFLTEEGFFGQKNALGNIVLPITKIHPVLIFYL